MIKNFKNWLINNGYKLFTANNQPSTVFDYLTGVKYVCQWENKTIEQLADSISEVLPRYFDVCPWPYEKPCCLLWIASI